MTNELSSDTLVPDQTQCESKGVPVQAQSWEISLLSMATEPLRANATQIGELVTEKATLEAAYAHTAGITKKHSRTFYLASSLMPMPKRQAVRALYAFCRQVDDTVDTATDHSFAEPRRQQLLQDNLFALRQRMLYQPVSDEDYLALAWRHAQQRYGIPIQYAEQLVDGVSRDLVQNRYDTFEELSAYAYGVASTVGLMSMHIIGFESEEAIPYAIKLGVALQITNILRDVGGDWRMGRLYLPKEELAQFSLSRGDIADGVVDERWRAFMKFQIERNRTLYREALPGIRMLSSDGRFSIMAAAKLYESILRAIEKNDYDVFRRRASVSSTSKLMQLPSIWVSSLR